MTTCQQLKKLAIPKWVLLNRKKKEEKKYTYIYIYCPCFTTTKVIFMCWITWLTKNVHMLCAETRKTTKAQLVCIAPSVTLGVVHRLWWDIWGRSFDGSSSKQIILHGSSLQICFQMNIALKKKKKKVFWDIGQNAIWDGYSLKGLIYVFYTHTQNNTH